MLQLAPGAESFANGEFAECNLDPFAGSIRLFDHEMRPIAVRLDLVAHNFNLDRLPFADQLDANPALLLFCVESRWGSHGIWQCRAPIVGQSQSPGHEKNHEDD